MNTHEGRVLGWHREQNPDPRDFWLQLPTDTPRPAIVDLHGRVPAIWDQGHEGACVGFGMARLIAGRIAVSGALAAIRPAPAWIYAIARIAQGTFPDDSGTSISGAAKQVYKHGYVFEPSFPYSDQAYRAKPSHEVYAEAMKHLVSGYHRVVQSVESLEATLAAGIEIAIGIDVYANFTPDKNGVIPMPKGQIRGGHCIALDGYDSKKKLFSFSNSWGTGWGVRGRGFLHYEYVADKALCADLTVFEGVKKAG